MDYFRSLGQSDSAATPRQSIVGADATDVRLAVGE